MYVVNEMTDSGISVASKFYPNIKSLIKGLQHDLETREDVGKINITHNKNAYALVFTKRKLRDLDFASLSEEDMVAQGHVQLFPNLLSAERSLRALEMRKGKDQVYQAVILAPDSDPNVFGEGQKRQDYTFHLEEQA